MSDEYLWILVAFVQRLPNLDANGYATLVASSEGHSHGGGETGPHDEDAPHQHQEKPMDAADPPPASVEHRHADGTIESHPVPPATPAERKSGVSGKSVAVRGDRGGRRINKKKTKHT